MRRRRIVPPGKMPRLLMSDRDAVAAAINGKRGRALQAMPPAKVFAAALFALTFLDTFDLGYVADAVVEVTTHSRPNQDTAEE